MDENMHRRRYASQSSQSFHQMQEGSSQWVDQSRPSGGFISFCLVFPLLLLFILVATLFSSAGVLTIVNVIVFMSLFIGFVVIFGMILRTGYHIKYVLDEYTFQYSGGPGIAFSIPLHQISRVRKVAYVRRLMGWGMGGASLSNRFKNGVCLTITKGHKSHNLYITPTNPDEFLERFRECKEAYNVK